MATIDTEKLDDCRVVWISIYLHSRIRSLRHTTSAIWPCQALNVKLWRAKQLGTFRSCTTTHYTSSSVDLGAFGRAEERFLPPMQLFDWLQPIALGQPYLQKSKMSKVSKASKVCINAGHCHLFWERFCSLKVGHGVSAAWPVSRPTSGRGQRRRQALETKRASCIVDLPVPSLPFNQ